MKDQQTWDECEQYLNNYLKSGFADVALINKCKTEAEFRFCTDYLYNMKKSSNLQPEESISSLEQFLNE